MIIQKIHNEKVKKIYNFLLNWLAYEESCMRCWSDLFLRFDRRNYKRAPLMFFSDVFYWMETNHPMIDMVTNYFASLSDNSVEIIHSII